MPISFKGLWHASAHVRQLDFRSDEQFFKIGVLVKKSSSIDPETPEKAMISVLKSYLVHLGSFKGHILYFCASIMEKIRSHWGEPYDTCALSWHSHFNEKAERAKQSALTCPYPSWRQSSPVISSPSLFLQTKFFAFVLIVHEYSFNHLACEQAHFCKFGENFGCRRGKVTKKESRIDPKLSQSFANNQV